MKNYTDGDFAVNKKAKGIVYRFADQTVEITLKDYLRENPGKTQADFIRLKALSDSDYYEQDRLDYRQTWKNIPLEEIAEAASPTDLSPEYKAIEQPERELKLKQKYELAKLVLDKLTEVQRRRYLLYVVRGLTTRQIAEKEGVAQRSVMDSIEWAEKKIKKFLERSKK